MNNDKRKLSALSIFENNLSYSPMTVLFTVREESGLWGARFVEKEDLGNPVYGFNCDGPSPYEIIIGAVGAERWEVEIIGKGSHAGVSPEKGISSTMIASIALANVQKNEWFGKISKNKFSGTSNIGYYGNIDGSCAGGTSTNQVTDYVKIKGESRSKDERFVSIIPVAAFLLFEITARRFIFSVPLSLAAFVYVIGNSAVVKELFKLAIPTLIVSVTTQPESITLDTKAIFIPFIIQLFLY